MREVSSHLDIFMRDIVDCDLGNDPQQTRELLESQGSKLVYIGISNTVYMLICLFP